ncbi:asparagine synthase (glutamine-hydrolysing) [Novosphingobium sp. CF614]|uniref:asparagine synthase (glutamine-hydrolyzing) n=1 Tax=Novosphingobium sp. CF614 TaxID=1884364 RepID=UPI0008EE89E9|nr:asparagine synthase (glutamine-hydrolyzing) [Novosphingobium sp. CF614]SFG20495.1 asparagine synthase (glutamine-hydrolysing) [Novosphingobium sp. CF614]
MCGIAGVLTTGLVSEATVRAMARALAHRGPDDEGAWIDPEAGIGLGHRRLSIVDLSEAGHQPYHSRCGRYVLTYNGEIYNHAGVRRALEMDGAIEWRGHSDTETLMEAIAHWGLAEALKRCNGMFALGLWDREKRQLSLARDRIGEKPLFYGWNGDKILFGSSLAPFRAVPGFLAHIDPDVTALYLRFNCVPAPFSIYRGIFKVMPGSIVTLDARTIDQPPSRPPAVPSDAPGITCARYWSLAAAARTGMQAPEHDPDSAIASLEATLTTAILQQTMSDVPIGAFLSGGVDSSLIVALMQRATGGRARTFTIGFHDPAYDEAPHAAAIARHLGTEHHEHYMTPTCVMDVIAKLPTIYDEPFADSSQVATHILSRETRRDVTVALSGDGGDELFGGYNRYTMTSRIFDRLSLLPAGGRRNLGRLIGGVPASLWDRMGTLPFMAPVAMLGNKAHKVARAMRSGGELQEIYAAFTEEWHSGIPIRHDARLSMSATHEALPGIAREEQMMYWDMMSYLPDDILTKVDRASMAVGLEVRAPMLDRDVVACAWQTPLALKIRGGQGKWLLRQVLYRHVPPALIDRPKAGFGVPLDRWLRGPLRDWAETQLAPSSLAGIEGLDSAAVQLRWQQHLRGTHDWTAALWSVLMLIGWQAQC